MAAPTPTARTLPSDIRLTNGHPTKVTLALDPNCEYWEQTVTPPGIDGGDKIDVVAEVADEYGIDVIFLDNVPVAHDPHVDLDAVLQTLWQ